MSLDFMVAEPALVARGSIGIANPSGGAVNGAACAEPTSPIGVASTVESQSSVTATLVSTHSSVLRDLLELTKPRIVTMILVTTLIAAVVAAGSTISIVVLVHLLVGVAMVAGSAGAMNQVWEREIDGEMERTRKRPIPAGRMSASVAALFSTVLVVVGTTYLTLTVGFIPAAVGIATWITYVPIYTPLKTRSVWNTTVGAISGALPILIGYTAAGGSLYDLRGWLLVGVLVTWQYPHFMAIAWLYRRQYGEAGFRMTTTEEPTGRSAGWQSVVGMIGLVACLLGLAMTQSGASMTNSLIWAVCLASVSYPMTKAAWRFAMERNDLTARKLLRASLLQLPVSLLLVMVLALLG